MRNAGGFDKNKSARDIDNLGGTFDVSILEINDGTSF